MMFQIYFHDTRKVFLMKIKSIFTQTDVRVRIRGVRNVSFSENFAYVLNEWSLPLRKAKILNSETVPPYLAHKNRSK